ncbi:uncharacterized protein LOC135492418 [Lineus longissimus]|uniref:uncharacterized protein LOC135492418 n=1 Tax=Lineus longissimus TaxID=88925 RepID=UPI002B4EEAD3
MNKMKITASNSSWLFGLLVLSTSWQMVELYKSITTDFEEILAGVTCSVNITDFEDAQEKFNDYITVHKAKVLNILISGIEWSDSLNETNVVFDPNLWTWATKESATLTQLPIDHSILSFRLTHLAIMDLEVSVGSFPTGCVQGLTFEQQRILVIEEVLRLTENGIDDEDLICQSDYSHRSFLSDRLIGVGKSCCNRGGLRGGRVYADCDRYEKTAHRIEGFAKWFVAISILGFLLPFLIILCTMPWWQYNLLSFSETYAKYLSNKSDKASIFRLVSRDHTIAGESRANGRFSGKDVIIEDNELESYETPVSLFDRPKFNMRGVSPGKVKITLLFIFQFVLAVAWLLQYSNTGDTLRRLDSAEKIVVNLHNNPYSWLWTDTSYWPFYVALVLVILNCLLFLFLSLWWLMEFETVRLGFAKCLRLKAHDEDSLLKSKKTKNMFKIFFVSLVLFSYPSVFSMFNCVIYAIGGLIVSIDIVSPWLTCIISVIYYTQRSYRELTETYTEIKRLVFKVCERVKTYKATHNATVEILKRERNELFMSETTYSFKLEEFEGPVWFVRIVRRDPTVSEKNEVRTVSSSIPMNNMLPSHTGSRVDNGQDETHVTRDGPDATSQAGVGNQSVAGGQGIRNLSGASYQEATENDPEEQEGTGFQKIMINKATLRGILDMVEPVTRGVTKFVVKVFSTGLFLLLVGITTVAFRPDAMTVANGLFITSLSTLLGALIPLLIEMMTKLTAAESRLKADILEFNIRKLLFVIRPKFKVIENASSHAPLQTSFLCETDKTPLVV